MLICCNQALLKRFHVKGLGKRAKGVLDGEEAKGKKTLIAGGHFSLAGRWRQTYRPFQSGWAPRGLLDRQSSEAYTCPLRCNHARCSSLVYPILTELNLLKMAQHTQMQPNAAGCTPRWGSADRPAAMRMRVRVFKCCERGSATPAPKEQITTQNGLPCVALGPLARTP